MKILIFLIFMTAQLRAGETSLIFIGGGGEPDGETTIFDWDVSYLADYHKKAKLKNTSIAFDGGHSDTEKILKNNFTGQSVLNFNTTNFEKIISDYISALEKGEYKAGDQIMVMIDSHGSFSVKGQYSHSVSPSDGASIDLDRLIKLKKKARERGVKLAVIDLSCHSGSTIALADENTCVLTATSPDHYAYTRSSVPWLENGPFTNNFISGMQAGKNLEELFVSARAASVSFDYPMISSPEGLTINANIYERLGHFLFFTDKDRKEGKSYILNKASETNGLCTQEQSFNTLMRFIKEIEDITITEKKGWFFSGKYMSADFDSSKLERLLKEYQAILSELIRIKNEINNDKSEVDTVSDYVTTDSRSGKTVIKQRSSKDRVSLRLLVDYDVIIQLIHSLMKNKDSTESDLKNYNISLENVKKKKEEQNKMRIQYPRLAQLITDYDKLSEQMPSGARVIALEEKKMYNEYYKALRRIHPDTKNPCRDFILP
jgi:hypothetical protein